MHLLLPPEIRGFAVEEASTKATAAVRFSSWPWRKPMILMSSPASGKSSLNVREFINCSTRRTISSVCVSGA